MLQERTRESGHMPFKLFLILAPPHPFPSRCAHFYFYQCLGDINELWYSRPRYLHQDLSNDTVPTIFCSNQS